jgi:dienelactone hydrolase
MTEVLLFHHAQGLTPGVVAFADELRRSGHVVHTPDLFDGRTFDSIDEGMSFIENDAGFDTVVDRAMGVAGDLPAGIAHAGFSFGVVPAQKLTQTRAGTLGALLC